MLCMMYKCSYKIKIAIVTLSLFFLSDSVEAFRKARLSEPCDGIGVCRALKDCAPYVNHLFDSKSHSIAAIRDFLKSSSCMPSGVQQVVCCPGWFHPQDSYDGFSLDHSCGRVQSPHKIVGGSYTKEHEFPWMARIGYESTNGVEQTGNTTGYLCGGTLISSRYVLTAAHCVARLNDIEPVTVKLGENGMENSQDGYEEKIKEEGSNKNRRSKRDSNREDNDEDSDEEDSEEDSEEEDSEEDSSEEDSSEEESSPTVVDIEEIIPHPSYSTNPTQNDIALIRLTEPVRFTNSIRPICLPRRTRLGDVGPLYKTALVAGWGVTDSGLPSSRLKKVEIPLVSLKECNEVYKDVLTETQMCAGGEHQKDSCNGDSGGPLKVGGVNPRGELAYIQLGIVSYGLRGCGLEGVPGVYTRVDRYIDWILNNVK